MTAPPTRHAHVAPSFALLPAGTLVSTAAHASFLSGDALDTAANALSWVVLVVVPIVGIVVFWLVHILPEKIAEKRRHPQYKAIQTLCLLSLLFGGLLWPLAWLWAYTKPVLHKMAYGTDVHEEPEGEATETMPETETPSPVAAGPMQAEVAALRQQVDALEMKIRQGARG